MVIALGASALLLAGVILLIPIGLRGGDRRDDALLLNWPTRTGSARALAGKPDPRVGAVAIIWGSLRLRFKSVALRAEAAVRGDTGRHEAGMLV